MCMLQRRTRNCCSADYDNRIRNHEGNAKDQMASQLFRRAHRHSDFVIPSQLQSGLIAANTQLAELLKKIDAADRIALDTEADSLHSYREKLCLLQISVPEIGRAHV